MSEFGNEVLSSARARIGTPFRHHFKPVNVCESGQFTTDECMRRGMDTQGYDCSGLAIASLCEVLGVSTHEWPRELRHTQQLAVLAADQDFEPGDWRLYYANGRIHIGIATASQEAVHASGLTNVVEQSVVENPKGPFEAVRVIAAKSLLKVLAASR